MKGSSIGLTIFVAGLLLTVASTFAIALLTGTYYYFTIPIWVCGEIIGCRNVGSIPDVSLSDFIGLLGMVGLLIAVLGAMIRGIARRKELGL